MNRAATCVIPGAGRKGNEPQRAFVCRADVYEHLSATVSILRELLAPGAG